MVIDWLCPEQEGESALLSSGRKDAGTPLGREGEVEVAESTELGFYVAELQTLQ